MMPMTMKADAQSVTVSEESAPAADESRQLREWTMRHDQVAAHMPQFDKLSAGDRSTLRDVANEAAKRKARGE